MFEWNEGKSESNYTKHGIHFEDAMYIFEGPTIEFEQEHDGETRFLAFGILDGRILAVVYTWRGDCRRLISARKANEREQRKCREALDRREPPPDN
jgi:uncharacterized protein